MRISQLTGNIYTAHLRVQHIEWIDEHIPNSKVTRELVQGYRYMPAYKMGKWDGKVHHIEFASDDDLLLFKLTWGGA